jgi:hypothetical protein
VGLTAKSSQGECQWGSLAAAVGLHTSSSRMCGFILMAGFDQSDGSRRENDQPPKPRNVKKWPASPKYCTLTLRVPR